MSESSVKESYDALSASSLIGMKRDFITGCRVDCLLDFLGSANVPSFAILGLTLYSDDL